MQAINLIKNARRGVAFTGAGVSVESGIPPFTGRGGLWNTYDPKFIEIDFFYENPKRSWEEMKKIFFTCMDEAEPNKAHKVIAALEARGGFAGRDYTEYRRTAPKSRKQKRTGISRHH